MKRIVSRAVVPALALIAIALIAHHYGSAAAAPSEISSENSPEWVVPPPGEEITNSTGVGANEPAIAAAPNGAVMIVYNNWMTGSDDRDPYYSISNDGGGNWSNPAPIYTSAGVNSIQLEIAYDENNVAHAVWVELVDDTPPLKTTSLFYARYNGSSWTAPATLSSVTSSLPLIGHPRIVAANGYVDVIWEEGSPTVIEGGQNAVIMHRRSSNGGQSWTGSVQVSSDQTTAPTMTADIEIAPNGRPHAVWRQAVALPAGNSEIRYAEGNVNGGSVTWLPSINVSDYVTNTNQPELLVSGNKVHVSFTQSVISGINSFDQWVYYTFCDQNCMTGANWEVPFNTIVDPVEVNDNSPFDVVSDIISGGPNGCVYIFFHGLRDDTFGRELVWNVNSCDGWNPPEGWDPVTDDSNRAIFPRVVMSQGMVYVTFQLVTNADQNDIYFMSGGWGTSGTFLPAVFKKP